MKRIRFFLIAFLACLFLAVSSFGQNSQKDTVKTNTLLSEEIAKKIENKDVAGTVKFIEILLHDKGNGNQIC